MYYDIREYNNGIGLGFYPILQKSKNYNHQIEIYFQFEEQTDFWQQITGPVIYGFIKKHGKELLDTLNLELDIKITKIYNSARRQVFPITNNTTYHILKNYHSK